MNGGHPGKGIFFGTNKKRAITPGQTWRRPVRRESSRSEKAAQSPMPLRWRLERAKLWGQWKVRRLVGLGRGVTRQSTEDLQGSDTALPDATMGHLSLYFCPNPWNTRHQERPSRQCGLQVHDVSVLV